MVLESTMICFDNSDYQRNGDYFPTRLAVQKEGIHLVCLTKLRSNPENDVGLMTLSNTVEVLSTLTSDVGRILTKLQPIQAKGEMNLLTGIRIAHLALKHRQGKNHKMRIVVFVGSPIRPESEEELVKQAKRLKKEKVNVDIASYGDHVDNNEILMAFINALNGKDGTGSHLVDIPRGSVLADALLSSPIIQGEDGLDGAGLGGNVFENGFDIDEDPELALALRLSMDEQLQRLENEQIRPNSRNTVPPAGAAFNSEEILLQRALAMSADIPDERLQDFSNMTEEQQIAFAMQMSMDSDETMDVDDYYPEVNADPQSEAGRDADGSQSKDNKKDNQKK